MNSTTLAVSQGNAYARVTDSLVMGNSRRQGKNWQCPAHEDRNPSLAVAAGNKGVVLCCHAGCPNEDIVRALGLTMADLFDESFGTSGKRREFLAQMADVRRRAERYGWDYRGGRYDRDMFLGAVLVVMERTGQTTIALSEREASELSGMCHETAGKSLRRLAWLPDKKTGEVRHQPPRVLQAEPKRNRTAVWSLRPGMVREFVASVAIPDVVLNPPMETTYGNGYRCNFSSTTLAASEWGVLVGKPAQRVYWALTEQGATVTEIAALSGVDKGTVSKTLRFKLAPHYAVQSGKLWARGQADPVHYNPETQSECGPIVARRRAQHKKDRYHDREYQAIRNGVYQEPPQWREIGEADDVFSCDGCATGHCNPQCCDWLFPWRTDGKKALCNTCYHAIGSEHERSSDAHAAPLREIPG